MNEIRNIREMIKTVACLNAAVANLRLYAADHPQVNRYLTYAYQELQQALSGRPQISIMVVDDRLVVDRRPVGVETPHMTQFVEILNRKGVESITFLNGVTRDQVNRLAGDLAAADAAPVRATPDIALGRVQREQKQDSRPMEKEWANVRQGCLGQIRELYQQIHNAKKVPVAEFEGIVQTFIYHMIGQSQPLSMLAELKNWDEYTFTHAVNVCLLTLAQAEAIGIRGRHLHDIGLAAVLHDAGKAFVPDHILNKSGRLSEDEWQQMRHHAIRGALHVLRMEGLPKLAFIGALEHHIRFDGSGYPPLERWRPSLVSQMISIADVFDAMRSQRPYQGPKPVSAIIEVLRNESGSTFNPLLVRNFLRIAWTASP